MRIPTTTFYGLKPEHNIDTFHHFFLNNQDLFQNLVSTNPMRSSYAIANLCFTYFDDLHSGFTRGSYLFDRNPSVESIVSMAYFGPSLRKSFKLGSIYEFPAAGRFPSSKTAPSITPMPASSPIPGWRSPNPTTTGPRWWSICTT